MDHLVSLAIGVPLLLMLATFFIKSESRSSFFYYLVFTLGAVLLFILERGVALSIILLLFFLTEYRVLRITTRSLWLGRSRNLAVGTGVIMIGCLSLIVINVFRVSDTNEVLEFQLSALDYLIVILGFLMVNISFLKRGYS